MSHLIDIDVFMQKLSSENLMIAPRDLVENNLQDFKTKKLRRRYLAKKALSMKEISDAEIWGKITVKAVKVYAKKHAGPNELFQANKGKLKQYKLVRSAVERIAKQRGQWEI